MPTLYRKPFITKAFSAENEVTYDVVKFVKVEMGKLTQIAEYETIAVFQTLADAQKAYPGVPYYEF